MYITDFIFYMYIRYLMEYLLIYIKERDIFILIIFIKVYFPLGETTLETQLILKKIPTATTFWFLLLSRCYN